MEMDLCEEMDFLCTADYITPVEQQFDIDFNPSSNKLENMIGLTPMKSKRARNVEEETERIQLPYSTIRQRVMSPPCVLNPFVRPDDFSAKQVALFPGCSLTSCSSRYHEEFHQMEEIGRGHFSCVYKVLKRLDGCCYAVKRSNRPLLQDGERKRALVEVQALASLGYHDNVVRYFSSWFENDFLYIQLELCDSNLRDDKFRELFKVEKNLVEAMRQLLEALRYLHSSGLVHLDLKPDNIYVHKGVYKLGDFGLASRLDGSMGFEDGDSRYLPLELINDDHSRIEKADMFSLGATFYELARGTPLTSSGPQFHAIRQGKLALLPGYSLPFQGMLKSLMSPNPLSRPTAAQALTSSLFKKR